MRLRNWHSRNPLVENANEAQKLAFEESKKKDQKTMFSIHQCVEAKVFDKISCTTTSKEAWDMLEKYYERDEKVKKVHL